MGLDMYAFTIPARDACRDVDLDIGVMKTCEELHCWRNHHNLHGWMGRLYDEKGGESADFNCNSVRLTTQDLDALEATIRAPGGLWPDDWYDLPAGYVPDTAADLAFIAKARAAIAAGKAVYYDSWW